LAGQEKLTKKIGYESSLNSKHNFLLCVFVVHDRLGVAQAWSMLQFSCVVRNSRHSVVGGWCAGRNPPFVLTAFSYTGYPRLLQKSQTPIRPFTLQVSRFTASNRILSDLTRIILIPRLDVPFLLRSQGSHPTPLQALQFSMVGGVSSGNKARSRPPAHQPTKTIFHGHGDKNCDSSKAKHPL